MEWWFYLTPFGWLHLYLSLTTLIHETGHLVMALVTGQKIIAFQVGSCQPGWLHFLWRGATFDISLVSIGDNKGGQVTFERADRFPTAAYLLGLLGGPAAELGFATVLLYASVVLFTYPPVRFLYITGYSIQEGCGYFFIFLALMTYWSGCEGLYNEIRHALGYQQKPRHGYP